MSHTLEIRRRAQRPAPAIDHRRRDAPFARTAPPFACTTLACALVASAWCTTAGADSIRIEVSADQTASVDGRSLSLKDVIAELCERAGVRLIGYEATDREMAAHYTDVALKDLLPRLLKRESFVVGLLAAGPGSTPLVSTLRVIGDKTGDSTYAVLAPEQREALGKALSSGGALRTREAAFQIPPDILNSAFRSDSPVDRSAAARYISENLLGDAESQQRFLAADSEAIARALRPYDHSAGILTQVRDRQESSAVIAKLDEIIIALRHEAAK